MVEALDPRLALGDQRGEDQGGGGAEVGRHHRRTGKWAVAVNRGRGAIDGDLGAHALEFGGVHEAGRVDFLGHRAASVDEELQGHELRLQVGREAWIGFGDDLDGVRRLTVGADEVGAGLDLHARFTELVEKGREVRRVAVRHRDIAARDRASDEIGAGFDAVGDDRVIAAVK